MPVKSPDKSKEISAKFVTCEADEQAIASGCWFDRRAVERVAGFFRKFLRHSKGEWAGQPFELLDWQHDRLIGPLFGWKRSDGFRRFRRGYAAVPKKNGKSTVVAGVNLFLLTADDEAGAEGYSVANDRTQAAIVYNEAANMVEASPELVRRLLVTRSQKVIGYPAKKSIYRVLSADADTAEGKNASFLNVDELHAMRNRRLWDALRYSGRARRQPLHLAITTAGDDTDSICYEQHEYAIANLRADGSPKDLEFFALIYAAPKDADWTDIKVWEAANPSWGVTIQPDSIVADIEEAKREPRKQNALRRYGLNQWTEQETRWLDMATWNGLKREIDPAELEGRPCYLGLDLSIRRDMTSVVQVFVMDDGTFHLKPWFWTVRDSIDEGRKANIRYDEWEEMGLLQIEEDRTIDYRKVREKINSLATECEIVEVAFDPYNASQITTELGRDDGFEMVQFRQGYLTMGPACKEFEELQKSGKVTHDGNPVLAWMASNVAVKDDGRGNFAPVKPKRESPKKIDGIVCAIMGVARAALRESNGSNLKIEIF